MSPPQLFRVGFAEPSRSLRQFAKYWQAPNIVLVLWSVWPKCVVTVIRDVMILQNRSPLMVYTCRVVVEGIQEHGLELDFHRVMQSSTFFLHVANMPKATFTDTLHVQEVVRTHLILSEERVQLNTVPQS